MFWSISDGKSVGAWSQMWIEGVNKVRKHKMGIGNQMCRFCHDEIESEIHVLRDCPKAMALWLCVVDFTARTSFLKVICLIGLNLICLQMTTRIIM